jgi:hypothetical protein
MHSQRSSAKAARCGANSQAHTVKKKAPSGAFLLSVHNEKMHPVRIKLPNKPPKVVQKEQQPDQRQFAVVPIRAATDRRLTPMQLRTLIVFCSYANRAGITWVSLKKVGEHLSVSVARCSVLAKALIDKGYLIVLYKGFAGERAQTRRILFNAALSLQDVIAVSGEKAPFIEQQEQKDYLKQQFNQLKKEQTMARKKKINDPLVNNTVLNNLDSGNGVKNKSDSAMSHNDLIQLTRAVGADLLELALSQCPKNPTLEQVQTRLDVLLK